MKIVIKTKNIKLTPHLKEYINQRINSLEKFSRIFQKEYYNHFFGRGKPRVEAWMKIGKESLHHKKGNVFRAEVQLRFPKKSIKSEAVSKNLKLAVTEVKDKLQREFKQYKEKLTSQTKRRQRAFKKSLHLSSQARFWRKGRIREEGI